MDTKNNIRINLTGLSPKEMAVFQRVISFNISHGLKAETVPETSNADLIITTSDFFHALNTEGNNKTFIVVSSDENESLGDLQIKPPLIITKVMGLITEAIKTAEEKQSLIQETPLKEENIQAEASIDEVNEEQNSEKIVEPISADTQAEINTTLSVENTDNSVTDSEEKQENVKTEEQVEEKKPHHALIIDDSAAIRKQLELELRDAGITSDFAECGEDAIEKTKETHFDLIFLDIIMPGIDGYETCKTIRSDASYKKTPIIMLSGKTSPLDEVQGVIAGATTYLTKPVKSDKLQETLNRVTKWIENFAPEKKSS